MALDPMTGEVWMAGNWWHQWRIAWAFIGLNYAVRDLCAKCGVHVMPDGSLA